jgi:hypothetical protein
VWFRYEWRFNRPGEGVVDLDNDTGTRARFAEYTASLAAVLGHADRVGPFQDYCVGLLSAEGRKSVESLAAVTAPERTAAQHQSLLHFVAQAPWSDQAMLRRVREHVVPSITRDEPIQAWIIDDTGFPKKGSHSVGVARQYCGQLGKQDNCQVAVSLSVATHQGSLPVAYRLYLPKEWADDAARRDIAGIPDDIRFQTKPEIALRLLRQTLADGVPPAPVGMDPAYGNDSKLRGGISELGLTYVAGILSTTMVWRPGEAPLPPVSRAGRGRPGTRLRRDMHALADPIDAAPGFFALPFQMRRRRRSTSSTITDFACILPGLSVGSPLAVCAVCWIRIAMWNQSRNGGVVIPASTRRDRKPAQPSVNAVTSVSSVRPTALRLYPSRTSKATVVN